MLNAEAPATLPRNLRAPLTSVIVAALALGASSASAQGRGQIGLVMGYPTAIGVAWHPTSRIGVKADVNFSTSSSEVETGLLLGSPETETSSLGLAIAGLLYIGRSDNVSTYFSPRFAYASSSTEFEGPDFSILAPVIFDVTSIGLSIPTLDFRTESSSYSFGASYGAQYSPVRRFSIFGEVGLNFTSHQHESSPFSGSDSEGSAFGVRSAVGVILYFN
jgi:hypothetical protein